MQEPSAHLQAWLTSFQLDYLDCDGGAAACAAMRQPSGGQLGAGRASMLAPASVPVRSYRHFSDTVDVLPRNILGRCYRTRDRRKSVRWVLGEAGPGYGRFR